MKQNIVFSDIDTAFGRLAADLGGSPAECFIAAAVNSVLKNGDTALLFESLRGISASADDFSFFKAPGSAFFSCGGLSFASQNELVSHLLRPEGKISSAEISPEKILIVTGGRIRLNRFAAYLSEVDSSLAERASKNMPPDGNNTVLPETTLFSPDPCQKKAALSAVSSPLTVITGGPGTGKTAVLSIAAAAILENTPDIRLAVCAPTGKAAARLKEGFIAAARGMDGRHADTAEKLAALPVSTIHRALKISPESGRPAFKADNPLECDVLMLDECSMIPLELMCRILRALPPDARLILSGDACQLPPVEPGSVFAGLCASETFAKCVTRLEINHRSKENPELVAFAEKMSSCKNEDIPELAKNIAACSSGGRFKTVLCSLRSDPARLMKKEFERLGAFDAMRNISSPETALAFASAYAVLTPVVEGAWGVDGLNSAAMSVFGKANESDGVPVMICRNSRRTGLWNGDIGVFFKGRVWFPPSETEDNLRSFAPGELPPHTACFAMTVHKAQGSGFDNVLFFIPPLGAMPILSRGLIYTGMTRTRRHFVLFTDEATLLSGLSRTDMRIC